MSVPDAGHDLADKLMDLEVRLAFQDRALSALDEVVRGLFDRLDRLEKELAGLRAAAEPAADGPASEPPPHY